MDKYIYLLTLLFSTNVWSQSSMIDYSQLSNNWIPGITLKNFPRYAFPNCSEDNASKIISALKNQNPTIYKGSSAKYFVYKSNPSLFYSERAKYFDKVKKINGYDEFAINETTLYSTLYNLSKICMQTHPTVSNSNTSQGSTVATPHTTTNSSTTNPTSSSVVPTWNSGSTNNLAGSPQTCSEDSTDTNCNPVENKTYVPVQSGGVCTDPLTCGDKNISVPNSFESKDGTITKHTTQFENGTKQVIQTDSTTNESLFTLYDKNGKILKQEALKADGKLDTDISKLSEPLKSKAQENKELAKNQNPELPANIKKSLADYDKSSSDLIINIENIITQINSYCNNPLFINTLCTSVFLPETRKLSDQLKTVKDVAQTCNSSYSKSSFVCPITTSPYMQMGTAVLNTMTAVLPSISSAKNTCQTTATVNLVTQGIVTAGTTVCGVSKILCEKKCTTNLKDKLTQYTAAKDLYNIQRSSSALEYISSIPPATLSTTAASLVLNYKEKTQQISTCKSYEGAIAQMIIMAGSMATAAFQSKQCVEQLSGNTAGKNGGQIQTMAEMCSDPAHSENSVCKCQANNSAVGCPGYIASITNAASSSKTANSAGVSQIAGFGKKTGAALNDSTTTNFGSLSDDAKKALLSGAPKEVENNSTNTFGQAAGASNTSAGGGGAGAISGTNQTGHDKDNVAEESKSLGSTFSNAMGSLFHGSFFGGGRGKSNSENTIKTDSYQKTNIQRALASQKARSEVSTASGVSNWEKVKQRYKNNSNLLINN